MNWTEGSVWPLLASKLRGSAPYFVRTFGSTVAFGAAAAECAGGFRAVAVRLAARAQLPEPTQTVNNPIAKTSIETLFGFSSCSTPVAFIRIALSPLSLTQSPDCDVGLHSLELLSYIGASVTGSYDVWFPLKNAHRVRLVRPTRPEGY